jgi:hypothetical protein
MKIFNITQTATKQRKIYPPNFTEITERRRKKFFSANLGVFGESRRKFFLQW